MSNSNQNPTKYYDLHVTGVGYVNRIREVPVKRGDNFWACDIAALHGAEDAVEYTRFDCRVSGSEAAKLIKRCEQASQEKKKILIGFKLGDLYAETFTYEKGDKAGETGVSLKARLLYISWIKVDGENVYTAPPRETAESQDQAGPTPEDQAGAIPADIPAH